MTVNQLYFYQRVVLARSKLYRQVKVSRKLVGYFENWEATLKALGTPQVFPSNDKVYGVEMSGQSRQQSVNVNLKKKGPQPSTSANKQAKSTKDPLEDPNPGSRSPIRSPGIREAARWITRKF
ncbi:unnamed protein product [Rhizophagus irregularis]|nr:unnamed protein product [Rhizophagus irregularis]